MLTTQSTALSCNELHKCGPCRMSISPAGPHAQNVVTFPTSDSYCYCRSDTMQFCVLHLFVIRFLKSRFWALLLLLCYPAFTSKGTCCNRLSQACRVPSVPTCMLHFCKLRYHLTIVTLSSPPGCPSPLGSMITRSGLTCRMT